MKFRDLRGVHGVVFEVDDPRREARRWRRALGLPVLRTGPREIVLGGLSFFVVLRRRQSAGDSSGLTELHVAVDGLSARRLEEDPSAAVMRSSALSDRVSVSSSGS